MRYHEIASGLRLPVSYEEKEILQLADGENITPESLDDERKQELARLMVSRGLLDRRRGKDGNIFYHVSSDKDMWRDR